MFSGAVAPTERIYSPRREATDFYLAVHPLLDVVATVERAATAQELQPYLRDVRARTAIRLSWSVTSSTTSDDNPENTIPASSLMSHAADHARTNKS